MDRGTWQATYSPWGRKELGMIELGSTWGSGGTSLVVQWLRLQSQCRGPGTIPGQGTRFHKPQLTARMLQLKTLHTATKTNAAKLKKKRKEMGHAERLCAQDPHWVLVVSLPLDSFCRFTGFLFTSLSPSPDCVLHKHHDLVFVISEFPAPQQCQAYGKFPMNIHELNESSCLLLAALESYTQMPKCGVFLGKKITQCKNVNLLGIPLPQRNITEY